MDQTGLEGVCLNKGDDRISGGDEDDQQQQANQGVPPPHGGEAPRGNQGQAGQPIDQPHPPNMQAIMFNPDTCITTTLTARPANYAIKHIEAFTKVDEGHVTVRSASLLTAFKNAKLDHQLSFSKFIHRQYEKWGDDTTDSFNWFFHNLDNHPIQEEGDYGERVLLLYASRVCVDWHDKLALHKVYNIAMINEDLLIKIVHKLDSIEVKTNLELVRTPMHVNYIKLILSLMHHHTQLHPHT
ncbi:hypothetical protein J3R82DRAFT_5539 [Butyriboletus roseoflavus]|nr:hypothetical protein J3R82DRAFT_5539 [Butyriboletus roseoflavus]